MLNDPSKSAIEILEALSFRTSKQLGEALGTTQEQAEVLVNCAEKFIDAPLACMNQDTSTRDRGAKLTESLAAVDEAINAVDGVEAPVRAIVQEVLPDQGVQLG